MKTTVYIPTTSDHLPKLDEIISIYNNGTVKPDEIVVSVFNVNTEDHIKYLKDIHSKNYGNVFLYAGKVLGTLAENRNNTLKFTTGDLMIYHDSNKLPSIRRVETIKQCFEKYDINILHHSTFSRDLFEEYEFSFDTMEIVTSDLLYKRYFPFKDSNGCWQFTRNYGQEFSITGIDMESVSVKREVLEKYKWKEPFECEMYRGNGEGLFYEFSLGNLYTYNKSMITGSPLTVIK
jgi:hypothetical protein